MQLVLKTHTRQSCYKVQVATWVYCHHISNYSNCLAGPHLNVVLPVTNVLLQMWH